MLLSPSTWETPTQALAMTFFAGLSTGLGGLVLWVFGEPTPSKMAHALSFSCGVMLFISFVEILPDCRAAIGFEMSMVAFFAGLAAFAAIRSLIPDFEISDVVVQARASVDGDEEEEDEDVDVEEDEAVVVKRGRAASKTSAGKRTASTSRGRGKGKAKAKGTTKAKAVAAKAKAKAKKTEAEMARLQRDLLMTGIVSMIGMSMHNFPEGLAVYLGCLKGLDVGIPLGFAIALHNIPEGVCVALPISVAFKSRWQGLKWSFISGMCEPLGALIFGYLLVATIDDYTLHLMLSAVAGIMVFICYTELFPQTSRHLTPEAACASNIFGMAVIAYSTHMLALYDMKA